MEGLVLYLLFGVAFAANPTPITYLNIYGHDNPGAVLPKNFIVPQTGIPFYDSFIQRLKSTAQYNERDLFESPMYVLINNINKAGHLSQYYAEHGLKSILENPTLKSVADFIKTPEEKSGIIFNPNTYTNPTLGNLPVSNVFLPDGFKAGDLFRVMTANPQIPLLLVTDKPYFDSLKLDSVKDVTRLGVFDKTIEPVKP